MSTKRHAPQEAELAQLESLLQAALLPQMPRSGYGSDLQRRLTNQTAPTLEFPEQDHSILWLLLTVFFSMAFILWGVIVLLQRKRA